MNREQELLATEIKHLPVGQEYRFTGHGIHGDAPGLVKRHSRNTYVLFDLHNNERANWGNRKEITEDAIFFLENGRLRDAISMRW